MTTRLKIQGREYDLEGATAGTGINVLIYMKKRLGISMKTIVGGLQRLDGGADPLDLLDDEDGLEAIRGLLWLVRTHAGDRDAQGGFLTLEQAADGIGFTDLEFLNDEEEAASPKEAAAGELAVSRS